MPRTSGRLPRPRELSSSLLGAVLQGHYDDAAEVADIHPALPAADPTAVALAGHARLRAGRHEPRAGGGVAEHQRTAPLVHRLERARRAEFVRVAGLLGNAITE